MPGANTAEYTPTSLNSGSSIVTTPDQTPMTVTVNSGPAIPPSWTLLHDDFEGTDPKKWNQISQENLSIVPQKGWQNSTGLAVTVHKRETYLYRTDLMQTREGYISFWFNANHVEIKNQADVPVPGKSIRIADVKGLANYTLVTGLRIWQPAAAKNSYKAYLEWEDGEGSHFDLENGQFDIKDGWQKVTLGFKIDEWIAVWVDDQLVRYVTPVKHAEPFGEIIELGKTNDDSIVIPSGSMLYDEVTVQVPKISDLWVDAVAGDDQNSGFERHMALQTIQAAADRAGPGTVVHILPGVYRESIDPAKDGIDQDPVKYLAEEGSGTVQILGSVSSRDLVWQVLTSNSIGLPDSVDPSEIYVADLSPYLLTQAPRFVVEEDDSGGVKARLPLAREPDWEVKDPWKQHEFWWSADGGGSKAACDPATNPNSDCDRTSRSLIFLTDRTDDTTPNDIEKGNLTTLGDLVGATLTAMDTVEGHYVYRRTIVSQDLQTGKIEVDRKCEFDEGSNDPGLGWSTRYYVEGKANFLDTPGEWWYDSKTGLIYLWPSTRHNPGGMNIEISVRDAGFRLSHRSNIQLIDLEMQFFNGNALPMINEPENGSRNILLDYLIVKYANRGIVLSQFTGDDPEHVITGFTLQNSEIAFMDSDAIEMTYTWPGESAPDTFSFAGVTDTVIRNNQLHDLGFRSESDSSRGVLIQHGNRVAFESNHVYNVAHNGVQFSYAVDQSEKTFGFSPEEIKTGEILIKDNLFEHTCQLTTDCGGLKIWGDPPHSHVYRDVLITGNTFRNITGWSAVAESRRLWSGEADSRIKGMGGFGLYVDMASGLHVFRNLSYNNSYAAFFANGSWRDGEMIFANNIAANSLKGFQLGGVSFDTHGDVDTRLENNILINNEDTALWIAAKGPDLNGMTIDHNLYFANGWGSQTGSEGTVTKLVVFEQAEGKSVSYSSLQDLQSATELEAHGIEANPGFSGFKTQASSFLSSDTPDFHLISGSIAIDRGVQVLPESLTLLLAKFGIRDVSIGAAYDVGRYEFGAADSN